MPKNTENELEFGEVLEQFMDANKMHHFESESGVRNITRIAEAIGYRQGINEMLADNPGMQQAMIEWLMQQNVPEWVEALQSELPDEDELPAGNYCDEESPIDDGDGWDK
jgi:hypothetical protein